MPMLIHGRCVVCGVALRWEIGEFEARPVFAFEHGSDGRTWRVGMAWTPGDLPREHRERWAELLVGDILTEWHAQGHAELAPPRREARPRRRKPLTGNERRRRKAQMAFRQERYWLEQNMAKAREEATQIGVRE